MVPQFKAQLIVSSGDVVLDRNQSVAGECPLWDDRRCVLCWVDIEGSTFWEYEPVTKQVKSYALPERAGSFALCAQSTDYFLFAFENGPAFYNPTTKTMLGKRIFAFEPHIKSRMNDGRCDLNGRFVVGGMTEGKEQKPLSNVYRINTDGTYQILLDKIACTNSICFRKENEYKMFVTDSLGWKEPNRIMEYKYCDDNRLLT